jgi:GDP-mannose 6-dehydrogenase
VLPGTTESLVIPALEKASGKRSGVDFAVCFNPEFLREGTAVADFMHPPFTILGAQDASHLGLLRELYSGVPGKIFETSLATAEMVKYVCNAFHALKVSFANEVGTLAKHLSVDSQAVTEIFTSDRTLNVSAAYLQPGFAFGGSCLPKDLRALLYSAKEHDLSLPLLESILPSNSEHIERAVDSVLRTNRKKVGVLGLSFKTGTDDLRESPLVHLVKRLLGEGCQIQIWDKNVTLGQLVGSNRQFIEEIIPHIGALLRENVEEVLDVADVVIIGTGAIDREFLLAHLRPEQIVIDVVNLEKSRRAYGKAIYHGICW